MNPATTTRSPRVDAEALAEVKEGLQQTPKHLPSKMFYDARGARLFEEITTLEEYYPTRTELKILNEQGGAIADWVGPRARIVEFGSGSGDKTYVLLGKLHEPAEYIPIDISEAQLFDFAEELDRTLPGLKVTPLAADYTQPIDLPPSPYRTVVFFPGSTIGNFEPQDAKAFLKNAARIGDLLIGVDLRKDRITLERAYNDARGVTAAFNRNILAHINRLCDADFDVSKWQHRAIYNEEQGRIEMHLVSLIRQYATLARHGAHPVTFAFEQGEPIVTEYSYKYDIEGFRALAREAGYKPSAVWTDPANRFSVHAFDAP